MVKNMDTCFAMVLVISVILLHTFIGGLGATFYVSYSNAVIVFIVIVVLTFRVYYTGETDAQWPTGMYLLRTKNIIACV